MPDISLDAEFHVPEFLSNGPERVHMPDISLDAEFHTDTSGGIHLIIERIEELMLILIGQTKIIFFSLLVKHFTVSSSNIHSFG